MNSKRLIHLFITLSASLRALAEVAKWRADWSWIPAEFLQYRGWLNIDPYHIASNAHWICIAIAATLYGRRYARLWSGSWYIDLALLWLLHGLVHDVFYHIIWMRPEHWNVWAIFWG